MGTVNSHIRRHHHITLNVGDPQEDHDFHTKLLGMKSVKKTALYDGDLPIFHFYYGNDAAEPSSLITCFPMRQSGRVGRPGTGQIKRLTLSVHPDALPFWAKRLADHGILFAKGERFGEPLLSFAHPCGICYELVGVQEDARKPYAAGPVPVECGVRGTHGITVSVRDLESSDDFMQTGWTGSRGAEEGSFVRYQIGAGGTGAIVDFERQPDLAQGSWTYGEGVVHHCAFEVDGLEIQKNVKFILEGMGYTDVSERKDRGYFDSVYVRTPGGALFEAAVSKPEGFFIDEAPDALGTSLQVPPVFMARKQELIDFLGPLPRD